MAIRAYVAYGFTGLRMPWRMTPPTSPSAQRLAANEAVEQRRVRAPPPVPAASAPRRPRTRSTVPGAFPRSALPGRDGRGWASTCSGSVRVRWRNSAGKNGWGASRANQSQPLPRADDNGGGAAIVGPAGGGRRSGRSSRIAVGGRSAGVRILAHGGFPRAGEFLLPLWQSTAKRAIPDAARYTSVYLAPRPVFLVFWRTLAECQFPLSSRFAIQPRPPGRVDG